MQNAPPWSAEGQAYLKTKLAELDAMRRDPVFREYGFGGNPEYLAPAAAATVERHRAWREELKNKHQNMDGFSVDEQIAVGELLSLAIDYALDPDRDNDDTRFSRGVILKAIRGPDNTEPQSKPEPPAEVTTDPSTLLKLGDALRRRGQAEQAAKYDQRILDEFPDSEAAERVRERLGPDSEGP